MHLSRRTMVSALAALGAFACIDPAFSQDGFPSRPVTLVVPYPPGGPTDLVGRIVAHRLTELWKVPVVVDNRPGASGSIGSQIVAKAAPDGYTLVLGNTASHGAYELLNPSIAPYKTLESFAPVAYVGDTPLIMIVRKDIPAKNIKEFIAYAKANPGKLNYASAAFGSATHLATELLMQKAGIDMVHVPFNGAAPALQAIVSGAVDVYMGGASTVMPQVQAGNARVIGTVSDRRAESVPEIPTLQEQGLAGVSFGTWYGVLAPAKVPPPVLDKINADVRTILALPEVKKQFGELGFEIRSASRAEFATLIREEIVKSADVIKNGKIQTQ